MPVRIESQAEPIPGYRLLERLGGGGFGEVWKAEAPGGLLKAIKFVYGDLQTLDGGEGARAEQELKALARVKTVRHPFILSLERYDIIDGQLLIVMELADRNLWDRFRECRNHGLVGIPRDELLGYMEEAAEALDLMNLQYDLQHLDIKPHNLFLVHNHIKVADFGLVKDLEGLAASVTGGVTPVYAAPETFDGWVSRFSDQYSLAIVYQELLTGRRPFTGGNTRQLIIQHLQGQPDLEALPPGDRPIVARALAKSPNDRHPSCLAFVQALRLTDKDARRIQLPNVALDLTEVTPHQTPHPLADLEQLPSTDEGETTDVTPPQVVASSPDITLMTDRDGLSAEVRPAAPPAPVPVRTEECGDGVLFPAVIVGLGRMGQSVLQALRRALLSRFGPDQELPHIRLVALDTDPEAVHISGAAGNLRPEEMLLTRLSRPSRYLRVRDHLPAIEDWLDPKMIYRIPRSLITTGIRALGRLAFIEHYRTIQARLRRELERVTQPEALAVAHERTRLGLRTNWPRVYVVTCLAGGTGSGMFLDLAYTVRALLREQGYSRQEVIGLFLLPPVDERSEAALPLANTYAALKELKHFMGANETFKARYESKSPPLKDHGAPFVRCLFLPLPASYDAVSLQELTGTAGEYLYRELLTPLGRAADRRRAELASPPRTEQIRRDKPEWIGPATVPSDGSAPGRATMWAGPVLSFQSFGLYALASSRRDLVRHSAIRLCQALADRWLVKSVPELAPALRIQMAGHFQAHRIDPPGVLDRLLAPCQERLEQLPEVVFAEWFAPLQEAAQAGTLESAAVFGFLQQADELLGSAQEALALRPAEVPKILREAAERITRDAWQVLADLTIGYVDQPGCRIAGAEEAIRQATALLEEWLSLYEGQTQQIAAELREMSERFPAVLAEYERTAAGGKRAEPRRQQIVAMLLEHLPRYPTLRFQQLLFQRLIGIYLSLRGRLSDQIKEVGFCRQRLRDLRGQLQQTWEEAQAAVNSSAGRSRRTRCLLSGGVSLAEAVEQTVRAVSAEELARLDQLVQAALERQFRGLAQVCVAPGDLLPVVQTLMRDEAERFLERRLPPQDVAELLWEQYPGEQEMADELQSGYDEAVPVLLEQRPTYEHEINLLAVPDSEAGRRLAERARSALPGVEPVLAVGQEEILFYREYLGVAVQELKQFGTLAKEAYEMSRTLEHFTPHTRTDITAWIEGGEQ
jgi:serine/threonine protein kinase